MGPFFSAILWSIVLAISFTPVFRKLSGPRSQRRTLAALGTLAIIVVLVILPFAVVVSALVEQATAFFQRIESGEVNFGNYLRQVIDALPAWATPMLERFGLTDPAAVQERISTTLSQSGKSLGAHALNIGQNTLEFLVGLAVMLYLLFFLLKDGDKLLEEMRDSNPLPPEVRKSLANRFVIAVRATIKGTLIVAVVQGTLGGLMFWFLGIPAPLLWGVLMGLLSLIPAAGTALVWLPVALYFLVTGALWQGAVLMGYGVLVIAMVDNVLSPYLISRDTRMPDYVVLVSVLGGISLLGPNGFVVGPLVAAMFIAAWEIFARGRMKREHHG